MYYNTLVSLRQSVISADDRALMDQDLLKGITIEDMIKLNRLIEGDGANE